MQKFKIVASKSNKKYNLILSAQSEAEARERVHKEWYSILSIKVAEEREIEGTKFTFHIISDGKEKRGTIVGEDIFKSYVKLRKELGYKVKYLYPEWDEGYLDDEKKQRIIHDLEQWYALKIESKQQKKTQFVDIKETQDIDERFYLKNELEQTHKLIEKVLVKLEKILQNPHSNISPERMAKLQNIYNNIIKLKKTTNISKLKEIGELALIKIWNIELENLEKEKSDESKVLLKETNTLLKKMGSWKQFHEKNKDINYILNSILDSIIKKFSRISFKEVFPQKSEKKLIDKESYSFLKTLLLLEKYKEKQKDSNKVLFKNLAVILFPFGKNIEKRDKILIKRKVIQQNITLLKAKKHGSIGSYTTVVKWYHKFFDAIASIFHSLGKAGFFVVLFYSLFFIMYLWMVKMWYEFGGFQFNYQWVLYFLFLLLFVLIVGVSRWFIMFLMNIVFFSFILIFSIVNF